MALRAPARTAPLRAGVDGPGRGWRAAGVALTAAVVLGVAVGIGRQSAPVPPPEPDAPAQDLPPATADREPGPARVEAGVPVGYARTADGAVAAAANYLQVIGSTAAADPDNAEPFGRLVFSTRSDPVLRPGPPDVADPKALVEDPGFTVLARPLGYQVIDYHPGEATIDLWTLVTGVGSEAMPYGTFWTTQRVTVVWERDDWRILSSADSDGPSPPERSAGDADGVAAQIDAFEPLVLRPALPS